MSYQLYQFYKLILTICPINSELEFNNGILLCFQIYAVSKSSSETA